jgi:trehalose 6-phosphate phosphatase
MAISAASRRSTSGYCRRVAPLDEPVRRLLEPLIAEPRRAAIVSDIDGTLAPIVPTPEQATVPPAALEALAALCDRYALVACVTGRTAVQGRALVPVECVAISGNHGLEVMTDGEAVIVAQAAKYLTEIRSALVMVENDGLLPQFGCRVEDKGITFTIHYRTSHRPDQAERYLSTQIVPKLDRAGLAWGFGRKVLEVRPPVPVDKGSAIRRLRGRRRIDHLLYVGDDRTDLDAFREATVRIAVRSAEGPAELVEQADGVVEGPAEVIELLRVLHGR